MNDRLPIAVLAHRGTGRTRVQFPDRRGDEAFFHALAGRLAALPDVMDVDARPLTGSVVICHRGAWPAIADAAGHTRLFMLAGDDDGDSAQQGARTLAAPVSPTLVIAGGLVLLAAWQIIRGHTLPPAVTLTWYASRLVQPLIGNIMKG